MTTTSNHIINKVYPAESWNTQDILLLAHAALRVNKGEYVKNTRRYSEDVPTQFANKELILYTVRDDFKPKDFLPIEITDEDKQSLEQSHKHMRRYTMLSLGELSSFDQDMFKAYSQVETTSSSIGILAYFPSFIQRGLKDKIYKKRLKSDFKNSKYITTDITSGVVEILKVIPLNSDFMEQTFMHFGAVDNNLVMFTKKDKLNEETEYRIKGKIKGEAKERETHLPMTRLNYVKASKL